jgi:hypothetical protein
MVCKSIPIFRYTLQLGEKLHFFEQCALENILTKTYKLRMNGRTLCKSTFNKTSNPIKFPLNSNGKS